MENNNNIEPDLKEHEFVHNGDKIMINSKVHYPDLLRFRITKEEALILAERILKAINYDIRKEEKWLTFSFFGKLNYDVPDE